MGSSVINDERCSVVHLRDQHGAGELKRVVLEVKDVRKRYQELAIIKGMNLTIHEGEFVAIIGKSGCGKSTLLRLIAGLEEQSEGAIIQNQKLLKGINGSARMMFQNGRFLPWKKVLDNIGIGLHGNWKPRAVDALDAVGLSGFADNYPITLSGGQKQRIALARALVHQPDLLLLDEPLGALDALTRLEMQSLIESVWKKHGLTCILVTHDVEEAVRLADRVILLEDGTVKDDIAIKLPRPRSQSSAAYHRYTEQLLNKILNSSHK